MYESVCGKMSSNKHDLVYVHIARLFAHISGINDLNNFHCFQVQNLEKAGILNKTKICENGKKVRWAQTLAVEPGECLGSCVIFLCAYSTVSGKTGPRRGRFFMGGCSPSTKTPNLLPRGRRYAAVTPIITESPATLHCSICPRGLAWILSFVQLNTYLLLISIISIVNQVRI